MGRNFRDYAGRLLLELDTQFKSWDEVAEADPSSGLDPTCWPFGFWVHEFEPPTDAFLDEAKAPPGFRILRVAGVSFVEETFKAHPKAFIPGSRARLVPEPENPHDPEAIAVIDSGTDERFGYLPRGIHFGVNNAERDEVQVWVLCHWRRKEGWNEPGTPVSVHILVREGDSGPPILFPDFEWDYDPNVIQGRSTGPE